MENVHHILPFYHLNHNANGTEHPTPATAISVHKEKSWLNVTMVQDSIQNALLFFCSVSMSDLWVPQGDWALAISLQLQWVWSETFAASDLPLNYFSWILPLQPTMLPSYAIGKFA